MEYVYLNRQSTPRKSNIELLRIIAMVIIVAHHFSVHGGFEFPIDTISINKLWIQFIQIGGKIGVNVFVLISGYFLVTSSTLKTNKVVKIWVQVFTYSMLIYLVFVRLGIQPFSIRELFMNFLPITFSKYWFASSYFILYLFSPYINRLLKTFDKETYQRFLALLTFCWCIIPTLLSVSWQCNEFLWFTYLYALAGYVRLHASNNSIKGITYIAISSALTALTFLSAIVFDFLGIKIPLYFEMQRLPILLISFFLFIGFLKVDIGYKKSINILSSAVFGVYLIHDNEYVRPYLWLVLFKNSSYSNSNILIQYSILVICIVFVTCTVIELARIYILEKHYMKAIDRISDIINKWKEKFFSFKIFNKL